MNNHGVMLFDDVRRAVMARFNPKDAKSPSALSVAQFLSCIVHDEIVDKKTRVKAVGRFIEVRNIGSDTEPSWEAVQDTTQTRVDKTHWLGPYGELVS